MLGKKFFSNSKISDKRKERRKKCVAREIGYISWDTLRKEMQQGDHYVNSRPINCIILEIHLISLFFFL